MDAVQTLVNELQADIKQIGNDLLLPIGGALVVVALIWGGMQYIQGNAEAGKKTLTAAIIGVVIMALASLLAHLVNNALLLRLPVS